ncbi:MAG: HAMP domain-containing protein [Chloroflexota bacterium]|nr:MAG: HAMP domain-containing protein [Chloroflexota bacterium]
MRSLTLKLTLAFLFVSIVGVALIAIVVRQQTQRQFDQFVLDRYQRDLLDDLSAYYRQNGSWQDFNAIVIRTPARRPGMASNFVPAPVTLTDVDGRVVFGGRRYEFGQEVGREELDKAVPVEVEGDTVGWVLFTGIGDQTLRLPESLESRFLNRINQVILFGAAGAVFVALILGIFLARTISRPVQEVTAATQIVAGGDLGYQVPVRTQDELGELAASFNQMSADLAQVTEQRRQMTADIAHDLRTPLSVILGYMEALSTGRLQPKAETFDVMYAKGQHLQHLIDDLRVLALADSGELTLTRRPTEALALLEHTALAYQVQAQEKRIQLTVDAQENLPPIDVDPERIAQVLNNLVSNALRHTPDEGEIVLSAELGGAAVLLKVRDNGAGIDAEDLPHIFDRFYRGDKSRQQNENGESGLGLAIAKSIVEAHGGAISVAAPAGEGTSFIVSLPQASALPRA